MVNFVSVQRTLLQWLMKMAGIKPYTVEIQPGTLMKFWVPSDTIKKTTTNQPKMPTKPTKPAVVLIHGFAAEGIITWQFQVGALTKNYAVYVPDLLFFGGSITDGTDPTPTFQAECLVKGLKKLGVEKCVVVGFSYGVVVATKMAELHPEFVEAMVVSGSVLAMTDSVNDSVVQRLGFSSSSELLLPSSVKALKALLSVATYRKIWFPDCLHKDYLEVMFTNRKERAELLAALVICNKDANAPNISQRIHLLWGENDQIFELEAAQNIKEQLGEKATFQAIQKAGHLVHLERPCVYNRCLKQFLSSLHADGAQK